MLKIGFVASRVPLRCRMMHRSLMEWTVEEKQSLLFKSDLHGKGQMHLSRLP